MRIYIEMVDGFDEEMYKAMRQELNLKIAVRWETHHASQVVIAGPHYMINIVEKDEDVPARECIKPPLGVLPNELWVEKRIDEVWLAVLRYIDAEVHVPHEWIAELQTHIAHIRAYTTVLQWRTNGYDKIEEYVFGKKF